MRILLLIYVTFMLLSTLTLFQSIGQVIAFMFPPGILPFDFVYLPITLPLTIWGPNGFMVSILIPHKEQKLTVLQIWRCVISYKDTSSDSRVLRDPFPVVRTDSSTKALRGNTELLSSPAENVGIGFEFNYVHSNRLSHHRGRYPKTFTIGRFIYLLSFVVLWS